MSAQQNKKFTVILADSNTENLIRIRDCLRQADNIDIADFAHDGHEALGLALKHQPDLLIINLVMPGLDGFAVLEELKRSNRCRDMKTIVISVIWSDYVRAKAQSLGVDYIMQKPVEQEIFAHRVADVLASRRGESAGLKERRIVTKHIKALGMSAKLKGYHYLRDVIVLSAQNSGGLRRPANVIYAQVADEYHTTPMCVERAIRHAIDSVWKRGDACTLNRYVGFADDALKRKPSCGELIVLLAEKLRKELG